ncbi:hypothetical protein B0H16DRAFT_1727041 [Mycena metata]|uniref:Uncharacterized protein n=1 Tax=Mycena metata TaxID=1033252 RepID=A0AAD7IN78_9AGAR|nr:hypothetical protein B0H16DRAFT_1727041 [Mycena metata]
MPSCARSNSGHALILGIRLYHHPSFKRAALRLPNPAAGGILAPARPSPYPTYARAPIPELCPVSLEPQFSQPAPHPPFAGDNRPRRQRCRRRRSCHILLDARALSFGVRISRVHTPTLLSAWTQIFHARSGLDQQSRIRAVTHPRLPPFSIPMTLNSIPMTLDSIPIALINVEPLVVALQNIKTASAALFLLRALRARTSDVTCRKSCTAVPLARRRFQVREEARSGSPAGP